MNFNKMIKKIRMEKGLSIYKLANKASLQPNNIKLYENANRKPTCDVLIRLSYALDETTDRLLGLDGE